MKLKTMHLAIHSKTLALQHARNEIAAFNGDGARSSCAIAPDGSRTKQSLTSATKMPLLQRKSQTLVFFPCASVRSVEPPNSHMELSGGGGALKPALA